jgi:type I restriction enzyme R subunit
MHSPNPSANFAFLATHDTQLALLGAQAEYYFKGDPVTSLIKMRQFGETLGQIIAAKSGLFRDAQEGQADLLRRLKFDRILPVQVADLFHHLRQVGNRATHDNLGTHDEALTSLKVGRELGIWFHRTFGREATFRPGPFVPPPDPAAATKQLTDELARLNAELDKVRSAAEQARLAAESLAQAKLTAEERAQKERDERAVWEQLAAEAESE